MSRYKHKVTASVPAARRDAVNAQLDRLLGCGPDTFHIPLEAGGVVVRYGTQWKMTAEAKAALEEVLADPLNSGDSKEGESIEKHAQRHATQRKKEWRKEERAPQERLVRR